MAEGGEIVALSVPPQHLSEFANNLFGYLYLQFEMRHQNVGIRCKKFNRYFNFEIGSAVLLVEKSACNFNNQVLDRFFFQVGRSTLCQKICTAYPNSDYFKKLYYTTAFIMDLMVFWHRHTETADLSAGPKLWIEIFQKNFDSVFEEKGGWIGFTEAGRVLMDSADKDGSIIPKDILMPNYFWSFMSGLESLIPKYAGAEDINMQEILGAVESLSDAPIEAVALLQNEYAQLEAENNPPEQVVDPSAASHFSRRDCRRKRPKWS